MITVKHIHYSINILHICIYEAAALSWNLLGVSSLFYRPTGTHKESIALIDGFQEEQHS